MTTIFYEESAEPESSVIVSQDQKLEFNTTTRKKSNTISLELGILTTTASDDSIKVKESNTIQSATKE